MRWVGGWRVRREEERKIMCVCVGGGRFNEVAQFQRGIEMAKQWL